MSRRLLQIMVGLAAINAIVGGGLYLVLGLQGLSATGAELALDPKDPAWLTIDFLLRALAGIWFVLGLMFAYMVPSIEKHSAWFRFCCLAIFAMGVGRLLSVSSIGAGSNPVFAIALEFALPPVLVVWQHRISRQHAGRSA